jgi:hypothetical protein
VRGESSTAAALADLMGHASVGAFDCDKPALLLLRKDVGVDLQWINPDRETDDGEQVPPAAQIDSASIKMMRGIADGDATVTAEIIPHCWARRETAVDLLIKIGIDRKRLPPEWTPVPLPPKQARVCLYLARRFSGGKVPAKRDLQRKVLLENVLKWDKAAGNVLHGRLDDETLKLAVEAFDAGRRG